MPTNHGARAPLSIPLLTALLLALCLTPVLLGDVVHLKTGKKVEGKIVGESADKIEIETKFGKYSVERAQVARIERMLLPKEALEQRVKDAGTDAVLLWQAAQFAQEHKLSAEYRKILELVVAADPNHPEANKGLGRIYYEGSWFTPEDLEAHKSGEEERMRAAGKLFYKGKWLPEETVKQLQGYLKYKGEWLKIQDVYLLEAQEKMPELLGTTLSPATSEHFILWYPQGPDQESLDPVFQQSLLDLFEAGFAHFLSVFQPNEVEHNLMTYWPHAVYVLPDPPTVTKFVEDGGYMVQLYNPPKRVNERYADAESFCVFWPRPLIVTSLGRHLHTGGSREASLAGFLSHYLGNVMIRRFKRGGMIPGWVEGALSHYYEGMLNGYRTLSMTQYTGFEHVELWKEGLNSFKDWYKKIGDPAFRARLPRFESFKGKPVEELDGHELMKSYFMVRWLMETHQRTFVDYVRQAYGDVHMIRVTVPEEQAFAETFGVDPSQLEAEFERWVTTLPPEPPLGE